MRILLLRKAGHLPFGLWAELLALEGHVGNLSKAGGERWENLCLMAKATMEYSGKPEAETTVLELFCRVSFHKPCCPLNGGSWKYANWFSS